MKVGKDVPVLGAEVRRGRWPVKWALENAAL